MKFNLQKIANPYTVFGLAWSLCLLMYSFGWAGIFPKITLQLAAFLILLIAVFIVTGIFYKRIKPAAFKEPFILNYQLLLSINTAIWIISFLYSGIPLLSGLRDEDFGIPLIKNFATSFNNFLSIYCFYLFLTTRKKRFLLYSAYCLAFFILVISRGNIMMSLSTMFFLWVNQKSPVLNIKRLASIAAGILLVFYLFGVAGNLRSINDLASYNSKIDNTYNSDIIIKIGDASDSFKNSFIPNEYFWSYIYITSPLSNLQYNINNSTPAFTAKGVSLLVVNEMMLDAISKKINASLDLIPTPPSLIVETLTVSTTLAGSYVDAGWLGMMLFIAVLWISPILYALIIQDTPLAVIGISTMCTIYFFSIFDNMLALTGLTFQLVFPLIFLSKKPNNSLSIAVN
jgi:oligosaccharide repeat unit polymerase